MSLFAVCGLVVVQALAGGAPATARPAQQAKTFRRQITKTVGARYLLFLPQGYHKDKKRWPLMLFLHGAGERGGNLELVKKHGPPKMVEKDPAFPFILVSPQCPKSVWWSTDVMLALVDEVVEKHRVDEDRIYVTGLSMGGYGTWFLAMRAPHRFAAIVPVCGAGDPTKVSVIKHLPVWAFHGENDRAVPLRRAQATVDALKKAGGNVKLTVYPKTGHDSWTRTYDNPELYKWLLSHRRAPKKAPPKAKQPGTPGVTN